MLLSPKEGCQKACEESSEEGSQEGEEVESERGAGKPAPLFLDDMTCVVVRMVDSG